MIDVTSQTFMSQLANFTSRRSELHSSLCIARQVFHYFRVVVEGRNN